MRKQLTTLLATLFIFNGVAQISKTAQMEQLSRGVVAIKNGSNTFVSWRLLATDAEGTTFDVLRDGSVLSNGKDLTVTNLSVSGGSDDSQYQVRTKVNGQIVKTSEGVSRWADICMSLTLDRPASQAGYHYFPNDCSVADLDGDGEYELIVKWDPSNCQDNSVSGKTGNVYLSAYKMDGTKLWTIDLGPNIRAGAHYTQFLVYDFNGDGRAELICKTAQGSVDGQGGYVNKVADDTKISSASNSLKYANSSGRILSGSEYLTVFEGTTGRALHTVWYNPNRGCTTGEAKAPTGSDLNSLWGDDYGNRCDRFLACVAHLDGADRNASAVMCRGYYTRAYLWAVDFDGQKLSTKWLHASVSPTVVEVTDGAGQKISKTYLTNTSGISSGTTDKQFYCTAYGQGCHSVAVGDVDGDGCDEIIYGSAAIDNNGQLLHTTGLGHGDALHLSDLMPDHPGLEVMMVHEEAPFGWSVRDANTGELLIHHTGREDTGRGIGADILADHRGFEYWHSDDNDYKNASGSTVKGNYNIYGSDDAVVSHYTNNYPFYNFRIYWTGETTHYASSDYTSQSIKSEDIGIKLESVQLTDLGRAKKVVVDKDNTTIVEGLGKSADIKARVDQIKKQIEETTSDYDREKLQERLAKLAGGVALIKVGAATEAAMKEKKDRVDDALHATRAAVEEGIVPGGGVAYLRAQKAIDALKLEGDEKVGAAIIARAIEAPLRKLVDNSGVEAALVVANVKKATGTNGYNVRTGEYTDLLKAGVVDPAKVVRSALQNAASIAGLLLTTDCMVTDLPEKKDACGCGGHGAPGGMDGMM